MNRRIKFPDEEQEKLSQIRELMKEWKASLGLQQQELFVPDGFYPYYFSQKPRILFIGREALGMKGNNYIETLFEEYVENKYIGNNHMNKLAFHRRIFYLAYGILTKSCSIQNFNEMPTADKIADNFATENGISFAFMNISKSSNENSVSANWDLINESVKSGSDFIRREIEILSPDVIITGNIGGYFFGILKDLRVIEEIGENGEENDVCVHEASIGSKKSLLLDCYHFSSFKRDYENFYKPVCNYLINKFNQ